MVDSVRLLSFNTQLRSWGMEAGDAGDLFIEETAEKRARIIAKRILASPYDYDIVGLMEVFDEDAREILKNQLSAKYPWAVHKCDLNFLGLQLAQTATLLTTSVVLAAYGLAGLVNTKFEDSGLMLFSRYPFARDSSGNPIVVFWPYTLSSGDDSLAAKGALLARVLLDVTYNPCDVVLSHAQADYTSDEQHREDRLGQFTEVANLIGSVSGTPIPDNHQVFFMGDLNVPGAYQPGNPGRAGVTGDEWTSYFNNPASYFTNTLFDLWVHEQSPGLAYAQHGPLPGEIEMPYGNAWDQGLTTIPGKRLDYILGRTPGGRGRRLVAQHLQIAHELMQSNPVVDGERSSFTSDHYPLRAHFSLESAYCRVPSAIVAPGNFIDWHNAGLLTPGAMRWHRFDKAGAYAFRIQRTGGATDPAFEIYLATNLSQPYSAYRFQAEQTTASNHYGTKFVLPTAPFFVRVFIPDRTARAEYTLHAHRFTGANRMEAISLPSRCKMSHATANNGPLNVDDPNTPWNEHDCVWFCVDTDRADAGGEQTVAFRLSHDEDAPIYTLLLLLQKEDGSLTHIDTAPAQRRETTISWATSRRERFYVLVRREDPRFPPGSSQNYSAHEFTVEWSSNLSYIYGLQGGRPGRQLSLYCSDETDGFLGSEAGADDIRLRMTTDGSVIKSVARGDIGPFNQGGTKDLEPWVGVVRYLDSYKLDLIEVDAVGDDDATVTIPTFAACEGSPSFHMEYREQDGTLHGYFLVDFDDGKYRFYCSVTHFLPI
ncbi:endonuclease/exonuclease/phosphatase family protein [Lysobacter sp. CA196]|uniref:endonuclease/exonuclease/phosphatase family protein n=1 Tax=Lysobacter sp. CA196 TaxID=3455606 RepID=UPI003F8D146B